ncbi:MAG: hypothetical protein AAFQ51_12210, partial [Pseudomonadota bacterium]
VGSVRAETTVRLGGASPDGGYTAAMNALKRQLDKSDGVTSEVIHHEGSEDIANALCDGRVDFAPLQINAYAAAECSLRPVATYGTEYAQILFPPSSRNEELHDLGKGSRVLVGDIGTGSALTWDDFHNIETGPDGNNSDWSAATPVYEPHLAAGGMATAGEIDAVFIVAKLDHPLVVSLIEAGWSPGEIEDKDLNDFAFNGKPLYDTACVKYSTSRWCYDVMQVDTIYAAPPSFADGNPKVIRKIMRVAGSLNR